MAKVLLVSIVYEPDVVSTATIAAGLARSLRDDGHQVTVLTSAPYYNPPEGSRSDRSLTPGGLRPYVVAEEDGVVVVRCAVPPKGSGTLRRVSELAVLHLTMLVATLRHRHADVSIVVSPPLTLAFPAFLLRALSGTRVIYNAQELWPDVPRDLGVIRSRLVLGALARLERTIYRHSDVVTAIGPHFARVITARAGPRADVTVIPNFVDPDVIVPMPKANSLASEWGLVDRHVMLYAGNIGLTQDFELVLDAADEMPEATVLIVGGGAGLPALEAALHRRRQQNVILRPFLPWARVAELYGLADVVLVPLRRPHDRSTTPSKIFSAMAARRPVLACADAGTDLAETVTSARCGLVVEPGDVAAFVDAAQRLLAGPVAAWDPDVASAALAAHSPAAVGARYDELVRRLAAVTSDTRRSA